MWIIVLFVTLEQSTAFIIHLVFSSVESESENLDGH